MKPFIFLILTFIFISCKIKSVLPDPLEAGFNNKKVCELIREDKKQRILKCTFPPKVGHDKHYHKPYFGYTLKGSTFRIKDENGVREVKIPSNTHFYNKGVKWHEVLNIGDSTAVFLIIETK